MRTLAVSATAASAALWGVAIAGCMAWTLRPAIMATVLTAAGATAVIAVLLWIVPWAVRQLLGGLTAVRDLSATLAMVLGQRGGVIPRGGTRQGGSLRQVR